MDRRERAHSLLLTGQRESGLRELEAAVDEARAADDAVLLAGLLVELSYQLRIDNVTGDVHPEHNAACEALLREAEAALASSPERPDGWSWLAWHTAARRLFISQERWADAVAVTERQLRRVEAIADADADAAERLHGWLVLDRGNA